MKVLIKYVGSHMPKGNYEVTLAHAKTLIGDKNWHLPSEVTKESEKKDGDALQH